MSEFTTPNLPGRGVLVGIKEAPKPKFFKNRKFLEEHKRIIRSSQAPPRGSRLKDISPDSKIIINIKNINNINTKKIKKKKKKTKKRKSKK